MWEFDPQRRVIDLVLRQGSAKPIELTIPVCAIDKPRFGAFAMSRLDSDAWRILPTRFVFEGDKLVHQEVAIHEAIGARTMLALTHAPYEVDAELEVMSL